MSKRVKHAVKRNQGLKQSYCERIQQKKNDWTRNVYYYTQQETLDAASLALNELFGFGPERLKRFGEAFVKKFHEIQELSQNDRDDEDRVYSRQRMEDAMKEAWGPYYEPREVRYDFPYERDEKGNAVIDQ